MRPTLRLSPPPHKVLQDHWSGMTPGWVAGYPSVMSVPMLKDWLVFNQKQCCDPQMFFVSAITHCPWSSCYYGLYE